MERRAAALILLFSIACALPAPGGASAQEGGPKDPAGVHRVELSAGEAFDLCRSGEILCPARVALCDDPKVAVPVDLPDGLGFRGVSPGTTLCSAASAAGPRRVFRVTVR